MPDVATQMFDRGKTWYGDLTPDTSDYGTSASREGAIRIFRDMDPTDRVRRLSDQDVKAICVRNVSGIALLPGRLAVWQAAYRGKRVDGYAGGASAGFPEIAGVVDDWLPASGVANGDLFWLIIKGPCRALGHLADDGAATVEADILYAMSAASSQCTTAGRWMRWDGTFNVTSDTTQGWPLLLAENKLGRATTSCAAATTNTSIKVDINLPLG